MIRSAFSTPIPHIPAFDHLGSEVLRAILDVSRLVQLRAGEVLLYQGDYIQSFYVVKNGGLRMLHYNEDGTCVALKVYGEGDVFGLLAVSGTYPHPTQIEAIHDTALIAIDGQDVRALMLDYPKLALTVIDLLTAHVHEGHERVRHMATKRVDKRLAQSLLKLCEKFGKPVGTHLLIDVPLTQRDLAEFTGTTVETINRTLTQWEKDGWVLCSHKRLEVCDPAALQTIVETP